MRLHRFIGDFDLSKDKFQIKDEELVNQLKNVLRLKVGDRLILCDGRYNEAEALVIFIDKNGLEVEIEKRLNILSESNRTSILYCAILKRENFELVVQKATEVGIKEIVPIITERTVKLNLREDRLIKIIKEAAEQSGRGILPVLHKSVKFNDAVRSVKGGLNLFFDATGLPYSIEAMKGNQTMSGWIGPEGGWTEGELEAAKVAGFKIASLGPTVLRAETAAIVSSYLIARL